MELRANTKGAHWFNPRSEAGIPLYCSAGLTGYGIDHYGNYYRCHQPPLEMTNRWLPMGNVLSDKGFRKITAAELEGGCRISNCMCTRTVNCDVPERDTQELRHVFLENIPNQNWGHIDWNLSPNCNYDCVYCVNSSTPQVQALHQKKNRLLNEAELVFVAESIFDRFESVDFIFRGPGEPILHPDVKALFGFLYSRQKQVRQISLLTNTAAARKIVQLMYVGFGDKLLFDCSYHILEPQFSPKKVIAIHIHAKKTRTRMNAHYVGHPVVREYHRDYQRYWKLNDVPLAVTVPYVPQEGEPELPRTFFPPSYPEVRAFLEKHDPSWLSAEVRAYVQQQTMSKGGTEPIK